ncbi:hypothetical protein DFH06DRAFT_1249771 [Mycena polygramma]|nr:hypothetical protein DFH06DRAFT_1249771 [Mycena polygramma]
MLSFAKLWIPVVLSATSVLSTLTVTAPTSPQSGATTTISWTSDATDPTFSIELIHPSFNEAIAISNNVDPSLDTITVELPIVPAGDGYTLEFVNITDINQVFATSADFSIAAPASASASASSPSATIPGSVAPVSVGGASTPAPASGIPTNSAGGVVSSAPPAPTSLAPGSQSAATAPSSAALQSTTQFNAATAVAPLDFSRSAVALFLGITTALLAGAWVL